MASRFTYFPAAPAGMDQKSALICYVAGCTSHDATSFNKIEPTCGSETICQSCPIPAVTSGDVCSLVRLDAGQVNVVEGVMIATNKVSRNLDAETGGNAADHDDEDEESFLQIDTFDMQFNPSTSEAEMKSHVASCSMDAHRNMDVSVRIVLQWYKVPGMKPSGNTTGKSPEDGVMLDITPPSENLVGSTISHWDAHRPSFLEILPTLTRKLKGLLSSDKDEYDSEDKSDDDHKSPYKVNSLVTKGKSLFKYVKEKFANPKLNIHFTVSDQAITKCRQMQRWKGELSDKSLLYTAVQNFKLDASKMNGEFLKRAIRVHVTCKDCETVQYVSCVQVLCRQKEVARRSWGLTSQSPTRSSGIIQPSFPMPVPASVGLPAPTPSLSPSPATLTPMPTTVFRAVYSPDTLVSGWTPAANHTSNAQITSARLAIVALLLCVANLSL